MTRGEIFDRIMVPQVGNSWAAWVDLQVYPTGVTQSNAARKELDAVYLHMQYESALIVEADLNGTLVAYLASKEK